MNTTRKENISGCNVRILLNTGGHTLIMQTERAALILSRIKLVGLILAVLMVAWIPVDAAFMPWQKIGGIICARVVAAAALAALIMYKSKEAILSVALHELAVLLTVPMLFFWYCNTGAQILAWAAGPVFIKSAYAHLPILVATLLSLFPLTASEGCLFGGILAVATALIAMFADVPLHPLLDFGTLWLLIVITGLGVVASMSQLHFMTDLVEYSTHDDMTGFVKRDYGALLLEKLLLTSERTKTPLSVALIDLDDFKKVNDLYGHDTGDGILRQTAQRLQSVLRRQDVGIRWGGEEFVVIMPGMQSTSVEAAFSRLGADGLGRRPDGTVQTASIGVAEYMEDRVRDYRDLVELADHRMYEAKKSGKNAVALKTKIFTFVPPAGNHPGNRLMGEKQAPLAAENII